MKAEDYIRAEIASHLGRHRISYREDQIGEMVEAALSGTGAFQIVYDEAFDPFREDDYDYGVERYSLESWKPLDRSLIMKTGTLCGAAMHFAYSYDGGNRYQWSEMETIEIDLEALREIKLDNLGI